MVGWDVEAWLVSLNSHLCVFCMARGRLGSGGVWSVSGRLQVCAWLAVVVLTLGAEGGDFPETRSLLCGRVVPDKGPAPRALPSTQASSLRPLPALRCSSRAHCSGRCAARMVALARRRRLVSSSRARLSRALLVVVGRLQLAAIPLLLLGDLSRHRRRPELVDDCLERDLLVMRCGGRWVGSAGYADES